MKRAGCAVLVCIIVIMPSVVFADEPDPDSSMIIFQDLMGKQWEGHFEDSDEPMTLFMCWQPILDGAAAEMNGSSSSSDMTRRNIYYFDRARNLVCFLALTSNGYVAVGNVTAEDSSLIFVGQQVGPDGNARDTKSQWEFLPDGSVRVTGFRLENDESLADSHVGWPTARRLC